MKNNSSYRLYGRTKGRKKKNINELFLKIKLKEIDKKKFNIIDIGAGSGESTIKIAKEDKSKVVICCDKYIDGLNSLFNKTEKYSLDNVYIYQGNVYQMLDDYCKEDFISEIWILFPDPWPKKRHFKRRLVDKLFFMKINKYLKCGAIINIASDSKSYISQILKSIYLIKEDFEWLNQSKSEWDYNLEILPETKYYKKAQKNGLSPFYAKLMKL
jgi:tRNA (guanine-N7-)-methyltransferase